MSKSEIRHKLKEKAKTPLQIEKYVNEWRETFLRGTTGNHRAYAEARDTRHFIDEERWIPEKDVLKVLAGCVCVDKQKMTELADLLKNRPRWNAFLCQKDKMKYPNAVFMWFEVLEKKVLELTKQ